MSPAVVGGGSGCVNDKSPWAVATSLFLLAMGKFIFSRFKLLLVLLGEGLNLKNA